MKTAFLDSSVLFTAVNSPTGGSAKLFTLKRWKLVTSRVVLAEVERNVRKKLQPYHLERFFLLVAKLTILDIEPSDHQIARAKNVIVEKDAVILAQAKQAGSNAFVTLDKKHFLTPRVATFLSPQRVVTPKMLFRKSPV